MSMMIEVKGLTKEFDGVTVLKDISLSIAKGEFVAVMGQSGCGKSTLLYNISGMDRATAGTVTFEGNNIGKLNEKELSRLRLEKMGFVFQRANLLKNLNIQDNILFPGRQLKKQSKEELHRTADNLMKSVGIDSIKDHDIRKVSGGQLQRAAICRALINDPEILFGDEPTGALNSGATNEILEILRKIHKQGTTIVLVTHDAKVAVRADRIIYLEDGRIKGELTLGDYDGEKISLREKKLSEWLTEMGF